MNVSEMIELLQTCDPKAEVRIATQSSYPFQNSVETVVDGDAIIEMALIEQDPERDLDLRLLDDFSGPVDASTVYIVEGRQLGYFTKHAWDVVR